MNSARVLGAAALVLLPLLIVGDGVLPGRTLSTASVESRLPWRTGDHFFEVALPSDIDLVSEKLSLAPFVRDTLGRGEIPWWSSRMFCGVPFVALSRTAVLYPVTWISARLGDAFTNGAEIALHLAIAGVGTFLWLIAAGRSTAASWLGACVFALNGMFATRHGHPQFVASGCWLPFVLFGFERIRSGCRYEGFVWAGLATALCILGGHPSIYAYGFYGIAAYVLGRALTDGRRSAWLPMLAWFGASFAAGLALASYQFLATIELVALSETGAARTRGLASDLAHWLHLFRAVFPDALGNPVEGNYWSPSRTNYAAGAIYAGVAPLMLAGIGFAKGGRFAKWLGGAALWVLATVFVTPLGDLVRQQPGFSFSRIDRLTIAYFLLLAPLAAYGLDAVLLASHSEKTGASLLRRNGILVSGAVAGGAIALAALALVPRGMALGSIFESVTPLGEGLQREVGRGVFLWGLTLAAIALSARQSMRKAAIAMLLVVTAGDLVGYARRLVQTRESAALFRTTPAIEYLRAAEAPLRIAKFDPAIQQRRGTGKYVVFPANMPVAFGIDDMHGYASLRSHLSDPLLQALEPGLSRAARRIQPLQRRASLDSQILDLLGVRYVLAEGTGQLPGLELAHSGDLSVYENPDVIPRVAFVPAWQGAPDAETAARWIASGEVDSRKTLLLEPDYAAARPPSRSRPGTDGAVEAVRYAHGTVELVKRGVDAGFVRLAETHYPGWRVTVDGKEAELLRADVMLQAVAVGPGEHWVRFEYVPTYWGAARIATTLAGLSMVAAAAVAIRRGWNKMDSAR